MESDPSLALSSISIVVPSRVSEDDIRAAAAVRLSTILDSKCFEIVAVDLIEEGEITTTEGVIYGFRYLVSFVRTENVIFLNSHYEDLLSKSFIPWKR